tara:strand:- start:137 stop:508 length:372 start_codon:yes stop_codon:yes gene_type:complete
MKKVTYFVIVFSLMLGSASALVKKDCSSLKKLSKDFIACKSGNLKAGIVNTGSAIKKGTVGKIKKKDKINNEEKVSKTSKIAKTIKKKTAGLKNPLKNFKNPFPSLKGGLSGTTKQYPKGIKK